MTGAEEMLEGRKRNDVRQHCDLGQIEAVAKHGEQRRFGALVVTVAVWRLSPRR